MYQMVNPKLHWEHSLEGSQENEVLSILASARGKANTETEAEVKLAHLDLP